MDVSLRLSLKGGHHWQFVCDEDDPMVFGLVSALPGATLDGSLPPDGLIQVEARNGERLFMSRSSLVALTINRLPTRPMVEQGQLVGIVSIGDVVKNRVEEIEREAAALRDYIRQ
jgi:CBS domain-containing protein